MADALADLETAESKAVALPQAWAHLGTACTLALRAVTLDAPRRTSGARPNLAQLLQSGAGSRRIPAHHMLVLKRIAKGPAPTNRKDLSYVAAAARAFALSALGQVPTIGLLDVVQAIQARNRKPVKDFSFDIYCPRSYMYHHRVTFWLPAASFVPTQVPQMQAQARAILEWRGEQRAMDYAVGLNSRLDQYHDTHLLMLDFDTMAPEAVNALHRIGGYLLKSGRGFHFIGRRFIVGRTCWEDTLRSLAAHPHLKRCVDQAHITYSLRRGYSTLRVTASRNKPMVPVFYKEV